MVGQRNRRCSVTAVTLVIVLFLGRVGLADEPPPPDSTAGQLLVAAPTMPDVRFAKSVIYMLTHDGAGALGVIVNRPMGEVSLADLLDGLGLQGEAVEGRLGVHYGGPVENDLGFVLHTDDGADQADEFTLGVAGGFALSQDVAVVRAIAGGTGPRLSMMVFGYAGWGPGQLETELQRHDWLVVPADDDMVFGAEYDSKWSRALDRRSVDL